MSCDLCDGTKEIPLLGPNTTSCPQCTHDVKKWKVIKIDDWATELEVAFGPEATPSRIVLEIGDTVEVDPDEEELIVRSDYENNYSKQTIDMDDILLTPEEMTRYLRDSDYWDRLD